MRAASQLASQSEQHHGGVRSKRAGGGEESRRAVSGGRSWSYRHRQVQAGHRDREAVPRRDNQRRLNAGKKAVLWKKRAAELSRLGRGSHKARPKSKDENE